MTKQVKLFKVERDVRCLNCGGIGAIQFYGEYHPHGLGKEALEFGGIYSQYEKSPYMSHAAGFGGTIPHECLECKNVGLIDFGGLEGYKQAFETIKDEDEGQEAEGLKAKVIANDNNENPQFSRLVRTLSEQELKALEVAVAPIYFTDSSDYLSGLWEVVRILVGDIVNYEELDINKLYSFLNPED